MLNRKLLLYSPRSILLLTIAVGAGAIFYSKQDLIISTIILSFAGITAITGIITVIYGIYLRKKQPFQTNISGTNFSTNEQVSLNLVLPNVKLLPGYMIIANLAFSENIISILPVKAKLKNNSLKWEIVISLPHRGEWKVTSCSIFLRDFLGLTNFKITKDTNLFPIINVFPQPKTNQTIPCLFEGIQRGDDISYQGTRNGDYFDLKAYQPSDGIKRIVWRAYARSGQLMSRIPEPTIQITGRLHLFIYALRPDDDVVAAVIKYLSDVEPFGTSWIATCLGAGGRYTSDNIEEILNLCLTSTWNSESAKPEQELKSFVDNLYQESVVGSTIVIAIQDTRLIEKSFQKIINNFGDFLQSKGITPKLLIAETQKNSSLQNGNLQSGNFKSFSWLVKPFWNFNHSNSSSALSKTSLETCLKPYVEKGWHIANV
jgi:hypothetical protein